MAGHENIYIVFFTDGSKQKVLSEEQYEELRANTEKRIEFVTNAAQDYPCDFDWNPELQMWQSKLFGELS